MRLPCAKNQLRIAVTKNGFRMAVLCKTTDKAETAPFSMPEIDGDKFYVFDRIDDLIQFKRNFATI
jgi:hypothetical protein